MQTQTRFTSTASRSLMITGAVLVAGSAHAAILTSIDGTADFGWALGLSAESLVIGAPGVDQAGTAYYHAGGTALKLERDQSGTPSVNSSFGYAAHTSGSRAIVGDFADKAGTSNIQVGAAYYYKDLDRHVLNGDASAAAALKLQASDGATNAYFGRSVSLSADNALVGAFGDKYKETGLYVGAAYYFRNLDSAVPNANGVVTENLKLTSDRAAGQGSHFGLALSLSGDNALVSALGVNSNRGEVYYYRDLPNATATADGTVKESFVLQASDGQSGDKFGRMVVLVGDSAIVGAEGRANRSGGAYYYRDLDKVADHTTVNETVKLLASDGQAGDGFGFHVGLFDDNAIVGARSRNNATGAAYFFKGLDQVTAGTTVNETVMLTASDGKVGDIFGSSVALNGTRFAIGANRAGSGQSGQVYTGDIRTFTVLDEGNTALSTDGISFVSKDHWIVGETTSANRVTVNRDRVTGVADVANVSEAGKHVYIGKLAGANNNELRIEGELIANRVFVGTAGNVGNVLFASTDAIVNAMSINLALSNSIALEGTMLGYSELLIWLETQGSIDLFANGTGVTLANAGDLLRISESEGYTLYTAIPEPATYAALFGGIIIGITLIFRRKRALPF